jgi:CTP-dependent riboflavin kinase
MLEVTGWDRLEPGSLNLDVESDVVRGLSALQPVLEESDADIVYPPPYEDVPRIRKGYRYYRGVVRTDIQQEDVLVRSAVVPPEVQRIGAPPLKRVELLAARSLKKKFSLNARDVIEVEVM